MSSFDEACPVLSAAMSVDEFEAAVGAKVVSRNPVEVITEPIEPVKPSITKEQATALLDYFVHIGDNPCAPKYCGVNVDIAADKVGIPRDFAQQLYGEYQAGLAAVNEAALDDGAVPVDSLGGGKAQKAVI